MYFSTISPFYEDSPFEEPKVWIYESETSILGYFRVIVKLIFLISFELTDEIGLLLAFSVGN